MIPLKSWIEKLILRCAKKDEVNKFTKEQQVEKKVNIVNSDVATNSVPTPNTTGVLGSVDFKDARDALIAALEAYRTPMEGKGIRLRIDDNYLGFRVSDEGIPTSYVNHPNPNGPANQIATMQYVADWGNALNNTLNDLNLLLHSIQASIGTLQDDISLLDLLKSFDNEPTNGSTKLVKSGGIYSWVISQINNAKEELIQRIEQGLDITVRPRLGEWQLVQSGGGTYTGSLANGGFVSVFIPYEQTAYIMVDGKKIANAAWGYDSDDDDLGDHDWLAPRQLLAPVGAAKSFSVHCRDSGIRIYTAEWLSGED